LRQLLDEAQALHIYGHAVKQAGHHLPGAKVVDIREMLETGQVPREQD